MIRSPLGLRLDPSPDRSPRDQLLDAARAGARGVVLDAAGDLGPDRLSETGRRDLRHRLRSTQLDLIALHLPTRRPFDTEDQLDDRLLRAERAFALAYELGTRLVLARVGGVPPESEPARRATYTFAVGELGRRADHRGVRLALETGPDPGDVLRMFLDALASPGLAASVDPGALLTLGHDPVAATASLGPYVAHAYATDSAGAAARTLLVPSRRLGFPPGALDWEDYLGALEEIDYRGYLTAWPGPAADPIRAFTALAERLKRF